MSYSLDKATTLEEFHTSYKQVEEHIDKLLNLYPDYNKESFITDILKGETVFCTINSEEQPLGFVTLKVKEYPNTRVLMISMLAGEKVKAWVDVVTNQIEEYAKSINCSRVEFHGRKGWLPLMSQLGYVTNSIYMRKEL